MRESLRRLERRHRHYRNKRAICFRQLRQLPVDSVLSEDDIDNGTLLDCLEQLTTGRFPMFRRTGGGLMAGSLFRKIR